MDFNPKSPYYEIEDEHGAWVKWEDVKDLLKYDHYCTCNTVDAGWIGGGCGICGGYVKDNS